MQTTIAIEGGKISVSGPYSESNNARYLGLGGEFAGGAWVMPDNDTVRAALVELFGTKSDEVEVLVPAAQCTGYDILQIGGYVLAQWRFRDGRVMMPDGVSLSAGGFPASGWSMKSPRVAASGDTVFRLLVRRSFAEKHGLQVAEPAVSTIEV